MVCGNCGHEYPIKEGIANFLLPNHLGESWFSIYFGDEGGEKRGGRGRRGFRASTVKWMLMVVFFSVKEWIGRRRGGSEKVGERVNTNGGEKSESKKRPVGGAVKLQRQPKLDGLTVMLLVAFTIKGNRA